MFTTVLRSHPVNVSCAIKRARAPVIRLPFFTQGRWRVVSSDAVPAAGRSVYVTKQTARVSGAICIPRAIPKHWGSQRCYFSKLALSTSCRGFAAAVQGKREDNCWVDAHGLAMIFKTGHGTTEKRPVSLLTEPWGESGLTASSEGLREAKGMEEAEEAGEGCGETRS
ncbi:hypothetical protein EYF80_001558 [Liparis tanakae]|uniref:Uncharacterized protein n=1 Tax=Liparis tanakae TaxID=230148 RepID=A0A4Z2JGD6_9TELE|nr:hypothetical protein EYF80_001558 [Liparis tanakae]